MTNHDPVKIERIECILSDNRPHVYFRASRHGQTGTGRTEALARGDLELSEDPLVGGIQRASEAAK